MDTLFWNAIILPLDYCSGLPAYTQVPFSLFTQQPLQLSDCVTPVFKTLQWFPIQSHILLTSTLMTLPFAHSAAATLSSFCGGNAPASGCLHLLILGFRILLSRHLQGWHFSVLQASCVYQHIIEAFLPWQPASSYPLSWCHLPSRAVNDALTCHVDSIRSGLLSILEVQRYFKWCALCSARFYNLIWTLVFVDLFALNKEICMKTIPKIYIATLQLSVC